MYQQFKYNKETNTFEIPSEAMWLFLRMDKELDLLEKSGCLEYVDEDIYSEALKYADRITVFLRQRG